MKKESLCFVGLQSSNRDADHVVSFASDCGPSHGFLPSTDLLGTGGMGMLVAGEAIGVGKKDDLILWKKRLQK